MPRTKKRTPAGGITKSTQTEEVVSESDLEIARLQEQVKLLQIQIKVLRDHNSDESIQPTWEKEPIVPNTLDRKVSIKETKTAAKGCHCKGNCSTLKCGCVKKDSVCQDSCKCNHKKCENKETKPDEGNKENEGDIVNKVIEDKKETEQETSTWSLGVREETMDYLLNASEMDTSFNPMVPKRQLPRTPPNSSRERFSPESFDIRPVPLQTSPPKELEEQSPIADVLNRSEIDWEEHKAVLVECTKCNRKYFPHRIKKHEACCKRL